MPKSGSWTARSAAMLLLLSSAAAWGAAPAAASAGYDPSADPFRQLEAAIVRAGEEGKRILIEVGGEWCGWCHILERFLAENADVRAALERAFVVVKVNFSPENENAGFLSRYPEIRGYPHMFVLDARGKLLHSQNTAELERGKSYDREAMLGFIENWGGED